jgi:hypothetical protein
MNRTQFILFCALGTLCCIAAQLSSCKRKDVYEREQAAIKKSETQPDQSKDSRDGIVWTITTHRGSYQGYKVEFETDNLISFVSDDGKKIYSTAPWQIEAQSK